MSDEEEFVHQMTGAFSAAEGQLGQDMYQANVKMVEANARAANAHADAMLARTALSRSYASFVMLAGFWGTLALLPALVWLWQWAV